MKPFTMEPTFFKTPANFRKWLEKNHLTANELIVGFYKTTSGKASITWPQSVDEALCFGWIDGVRKSIDEESYLIRFTPRKPTSIWSSINIKKIEELSKQGLVKPMGIEAFNKRKENKSGIYIHENESAVLKPTYEKKFKANKKAWEFFQKQAPFYKKLMIGRIMNAKQEATQIKRLEATIAASNEGKRIL